MGGSRPQALWRFEQKRLDFFPITSPSIKEASVPQGTASMFRFPFSLSLVGALVSCVGTPKAPDPGTDYTLVANPNRITSVAIMGGGGRGTATITWINCAPQTVGLSLANAPVGVATVFAPSSTSTTSTFNLTFPNAPPLAGFYHMQIQGVAADVHHAAELDLAVQDFTLAQPADVTRPVATPTVIVPISFMRAPVEAPFAGNVAFTAFTPATFYAPSFSPATVTNPGTTTTLTLSAAAGATGTWPVTVTGTDSVTGLTHSVTFNVILQ